MPRQNGHGRGELLVGHPVEAVGHRHSRVVDEQRELDETDAQKIALEHAGAEGVARELVKSLVQPEAQQDAKHGARGK